jgi:hypothetical protein
MHQHANDGKSVQHAEELSARSEILSSEGQLRHVHWVGKAETHADGIQHREEGRDVFLKGKHGGYVSWGPVS